MSLRNDGSAPLVVADDIGSAEAGADYAVVCGDVGPEAAMQGAPLLVMACTSTLFPSGAMTSTPNTGPSALVSKGRRRAAPPLFVRPICANQIPASDG
jgi:hypothetical protein